MFIVEVLEPRLNCRVSSTFPTALQTTTTPPTTRLPLIVGVNLWNSTTSVPHALDSIEMLCGYRSHYVKPSALECLDHLSSYLIHRNWLIGLACEYVFVILAGCCVSFHAIFKRRSMDNQSGNKSVLALGAEEGKRNRRQ